MTTFFSNIPTFKDVKNLDLQTFLQLSNMICDFLGLWDSKFSILRNDVEGNIKKVSRASANLHVNTLYDLLVNERNRDDSSGSIGLLWLKRTFQFINCFLHNFSVSKSNELMSDIITRAYNETLTRHHNILMRHAFRFVLRVVPKRSVFIRKLGFEQGDNELIVLQEAEKFTNAIEPHLKSLNYMLIHFGLEDPHIN
ncbi:Pleckstrin homology domain-containing family A member 8 [Schistosoma japonicum]|uniref:Pleckstrin homology domain-containing family A member 8 n=1 Tax=Schistosoma japonicum TaxID=6182 RepID=A0A4Z2DFS9_SCHJA|nr:Pleckstrin homology domain-containing family A member 8 [Schistosoma japonicum]